MEREGRSASRCFVPDSSEGPVSRSGRNRSLRVPQKAILQRGQLVSVFIVDSVQHSPFEADQDRETVRRPIEVLSGLNDGDRIVVEGMEKVKEGDRVQ